MVGDIWQGPYRNFYKLLQADRSEPPWRLVDQTDQFACDLWLLQKKNIATILFVFTCNMQNNNFLEG